MKLSLLLTLITVNIFAQKSTNTLEGYFKNNNNDDLYTSIYLDGKGHALINEAYEAEYFQREDLLYVFPDKSVFILKVDKDNLKGKSSWVKKLTFKKNNAPELDENRPFATNLIDPELLYAFYKLNFKEGTDEANFSIFEDEAHYIEHTKKLCDQGLTAACGAQFGLLYLQELGGFDKLFEERSVLKINKSKVLEDLANKMISLGDMRGYALLASYYYAIGNEELAFKTYQIGSENGDQKSTSILLEMELNKILEDENEIE